MLVTRLKFLGDVVLTTPVLEVLRERFPEATIEYLAHAAHGRVLEHHPCVDTLHLLPDEAGWRATLAMAARLRRRRFDWAIDLFGNPRSALLLGLARPGRSVGPKRGLRSRVYTHRRSRPAGDRSAIRHHLDKLVPLLGRAPAARRPRLHVSEDERAAARARIGTERFVLVHPGSTWPHKAWPRERWPELIRGLRANGVDRVLVVEPPTEAPLARTLVPVGADGVEPLPVLDLRSLLAVVSLAALYVGNDGGMLHAAVALGVPTLGLFGPTEEDIWFPYTSFGPYRVLRDRGKGEPGRPPLAGLDTTEVLENALALYGMGRCPEGGGRG